MNAKIIKSNPPETTEILASSVVKISEAMEKLLNAPGGLKREAIVLLIHDMTKVGKTDIRQVLDALPQLRGYWCRKS